MNSGYRYTDIVTPEYAGYTVLQYYATRYRHSAVAEWLQRIEEGRILYKERPALADETIEAGELLIYHRQGWKEPQVPLATELLAQSKGWMVFNKPGGLPVLPGAGFLEHTLLYRVRKTYGTSLAPVHRLGRGTTGAILFSTDKGAAAFLAKVMREQRIEKTYLALASGIPSDEAFTIAVPIGPVPHSILGSVYAVNANGKPSISHCRVLVGDSSRNHSLIEVVIPTGRYMSG